MFQKWVHFSQLKLQWPLLVKCKASVKFGRQGGGKGGFSCVPPFGAQVIHTCISMVSGLKKKLLCMKYLMFRNFLLFDKLISQESLHLSAQSICTARPPSFPCQCHLWLRRLKPPRQERLALYPSLRTGKWDTRVRSSSAAQSEAPESSKGGTGPLETQGDCRGGVPGSPGSWPQQRQEMEQSQHESQERTRRAKSPRGLIYWSIYVFVCLFI